MHTLIIGVVLLVLAIAGLSLTFSLLGVLVTLLVAALVGVVADRIVPGELPYGWLGAIGAGLLGSWLGTMLVGPVGPELAGIPVLPALLGAVILAFGISLLQKRMGRSRTTTTRRY